VIWGFHSVVDKYESSGLRQSLLMYVDTDISAHVWSRQTWGCVSHQILNHEVGTASFLRPKNPLTSKQCPRIVILWETGQNKRKRYVANGWCQNRNEISRSELISITSTLTFIPFFNHSDRRRRFFRSVVTNINWLHAWHMHHRTNLEDCDELQTVTFTSYSDSTLLHRVSLLSSLGTTLAMGLSASFHILLTRQ
jgi:hypothetical protein